MTLAISIITFTIELIIGYFIIKAYPKETHKITNKQSMIYATLATVFIAINQGWLISGFVIALIIERQFRITCIFWTITFILNWIMLAKNEQLQCK